MQKGIYEYARARAGHYAKVLFKEQAFAEAVERSRWAAYPLGLAMVGELVEGVLRPLAGDDRSRQLEALRALVLSRLRPLSGTRGCSASEPGARRAPISTPAAARSACIRPSAPSRSPMPFARAYFDLMPINERLRAERFPTMHGYLKVTLCNVHEELTKRMDAPALVPRCSKARPARRMR